MYLQPPVTAWLSVRHHQNKKTFNVLRMFIEHCDDQFGGEAEEVWQEVEEEKPCEETLEENTGGLGHDADGRDVDAGGVGQ